MNVAKWFLADSHCTGQVRGISPMRHVNMRSPHWRCDCKNACYESDMEGTRLLVFQYSHQPQVLDAMRVARARGMATVYDIDDNWLVVGGRDAAAPDAQQDRLTGQSAEVMKAFMRECDITVFSTPMLRDLILERVAPRATAVIRNSLDPDIWTTATRSRPPSTAGSAGPDDDLVIGLYGSMCHNMGMHLVRDALSAILDEFRHVRVELTGPVDPAHLMYDRHADRVTSRKGWLPYHQMPSIVANIDIGLCPLPRNAWNDGKSEHKWVQYAACGVPVIASPSPVFASVARHDEDILLAPEDSPSGWYEALRYLVTTPNAREVLGRNAKARFLRDYDLRNTYVQWTNVFDEAVARRNAAPLKG